MRRLWWLAVPIAGLLSFAVAATRRPSLPALHYMNVGVEDWQPGPANFVIYLSTGDAAVTRIEGWATYGPQPGANVVQGSAEYIRQTLVSLTYKGAPAAPGVSFAGVPAQREEHSLSTNLFDLNLKQTAAQTSTVPINVTFPQPVPVPRTLIVHYQNTTYEVGGDVSAPIQALDTELHFLVFYQ